MEVPLPGLETERLEQLAKEVRNCLQWAFIKVDIKLSLHIGLCPNSSIYQE